MQARLKIVTITTLMAFVLTGCAMQPEIVIKPDFVAPEFDPSSVEEIVVLPAVDIRQDRSASAEGIQEWMIEHSDPDYERFSARARLSEKGYAVRTSSSLGVASITEDELAEQGVQWIKKLGPDDARWVMLLALEDLAEVGGFGASWSAECSGYLFDKSSGKLVWRHDAIGRAEVGGLIGLALADLARQDAMFQFALELFEQVPNKITAK